MIPLTIDLKLFIVIYFSFIGFTIVGTLSHEFGHYSVGRFLWYQPTLHYGFTSWGDSDLSTEIRFIYQANKAAIEAEKHFSQKERFVLLLKKRDVDHFWMILGGPVQTMLTGTIGFLLLLFRFRSKTPKHINFVDWLFIFLTLFWLRQTANLASWIMGYSLRKVRGTGDEIRLAHYWNLPEGSVILVTGFIGLLISNYVLLKYVPKDKLLTFYLGGLLGGVSGYIIWLNILGPFILP